MNRIASLLVALACGLAVRTAGAALTDPAQIMNEAYIHLVQGDQGLDAGRLDEALSLYSQARDYYQRLSREFPGFEPRIIQYRKTYCDNQIADIERRQGMAPGADLPPLRAQAPTWTPPAPALAPMAPPPAALPATTERSVEVDYLKGRIDSLEAELAEIDILQEELDAMTAEKNRLSAQVAEANRQLASRSQGEQEAVQSLRAELAAKDEQIQSLQRDLDAKRQLDQALNDMEAKVNELRTMTDRLNEEIKTLDAELDDAEVRADQADFRARQAEEQLAAAVTRAEMAEQELQIARAVPAAKPVETAKADKPARAKDEPKKAPEPRKDAKPAEKAPKADPPKPAAAPPVASTASVPPKPIPNGLSAADFVRQLLQEGDNEAALATVQNARRAARADMNLALIEGIALIRLQRYNEAAALLIDIAKRNPRNAEVHATLGAAMMGAGFYDEARDTLLLAIRLDKNLPECHYNLAQLYAFIEPINLRLARRHYRNARDLGVTPDPQLDAALQ